MLWTAVAHEHTEDDPGQRPLQQSIAELFSVDNLPNVVHHFFQSVL